MPVGNVLIGDTGSNIEHDDTALAVDIVTISETTELLLTGGIPDVELDDAQVLNQARKKGHVSYGMISQKLLIVGGVVEGENIPL